MAPPKEPNEELKFVMMCIKYSETELKPNYDEVARETGAKSANACYHRLWSIKKKLGLTGSGHKRSTGDGGTATAAAGTRKRKTAAIKDEDGSADEPTPKRKKRTTKKSAAAPVKDEPDSDGVDTGNEEAGAAEVNVEE